MFSIRSQLHQAVSERLRQSEALQTAIRTDLTAPISMQELPLITVNLEKANTVSDWSALDANGALLEMVEQPIVVKITACARQGLEKKLEQLAAQTSHVLAHDETLGGLIKSIYIEEDAELSISHEGEQPIGVLTMRFVALYRRSALNLSATCN